MGNRLHKKQILDVPHTPKLVLWGGIECTVNRVADVYQDQVRRCGHHDRPGDLDCIADLGIRTLRYPVYLTSAAATPNQRVLPIWCVNSPLANLLARLFHQDQAGGRLANL